MSPRTRKLALTAHVTSSVSWLGAVACVLVLAVTGLTSRDGETVRAAYIAIDSLAWSVLVPLSIASLLTGLVQSLGTAWGLFRHYWIVVKLAINLLATTVLLLYTQTLSDLAGVAADPASSTADLRDLSSASPVVHAAAALLLLLVATVLAVNKPRGRTRYGRRKQREQRATLRP